MTTDAQDNPIDRSKDSAPTSVRVSITIDPMDHVAGDVAGLIGNFAFEMLGAVSMPRRASSWANVMIIELVTNVMEHGATRDEPLRVDLALQGDELTIAVRPDGIDSDVARGRFALNKNVDDPKNLLADTVQCRRIDRAQGGLGLMRIGAGTKPPSGGFGGDGGAPAEAAIPLVPKPPRIT